MTKYQWIYNIRWLTSAARGTFSGFFQLCGNIFVNTGLSATSPNCWYNWWITLVCGNFSGSSPDFSWEYHLGKIPLQMEDTIVFSGHTGHTIVAIRLNKTVVRWFINWSNSLANKSETVVKKITVSIKIPVSQTFACNLI